VATTLLEQRRAQMFPKLTSAQLARLEHQGTPLQTRTGEILLELGDSPRGVFIVAAGSLEVLAPPSATQTAWGDAAQSPRSLRGRGRSALLAMPPFELSMPPAR
jgi:hypothetical protein